jgi:hypothetical protein
MFNEAIDNIDKALARKDTQEWEDYADEYGLSLFDLEDSINNTLVEVAEAIRNIEGELGFITDAANKPFDELL